MVEKEKAFSDRRWTDPPEFKATGESVERTPEDRARIETEFDTILKEQGIKK